MDEFFISLNFDVVDYRLNTPKSESILASLKKLAWVRDITDHRFFPQDGDIFFYNDGLGKGVSKCNIASVTWRNTDMRTMHEKGLAPKEDHVLFFPTNSQVKWVVQAATGFNDYNADYNCEGVFANFVFSNQKQRTSSGKDADILSFPTFFTPDTVCDELWYKNSNLKLPKDTKGKRPSQIPCKTTFMLKFKDKYEKKDIWICWDPRIVVELDDSP